jgi:hypothetical protein
MELLKDYDILKEIIKTVPDDYIIHYLIDNDKYNLLRNYITNKDANSYGFDINMKDTYKKIFKYDYDLYCIFIRKIFQYKTNDNSKYINDYMLEDIRYLYPIGNRIKNYNDICRLILYMLTDYEGTKYRQSIKYIMKNSINSFSDLWDEFHQLISRLYMYNILVSCIKYYDGSDFLFINKIIYNFKCFHSWNNFNKVFIECLKMVIKYNQMNKLNELINNCAKK